jgi:hypothetical protein
MRGRLKGTASSPRPVPPARRHRPVCADRLRRRFRVPSPPLIGGGEGQGEVGDRPQRPRPGGAGATCPSHGRGPAPPHPDPLRPMAGRRGGASVLRHSPVCARTLRRRSGVPSPPLIGGGEGQGEVGDRPQRPRPGGAVMVRHSKAMAVAPPHLTPALSAPWRGGEGARRRRKFLLRKRATAFTHLPGYVASPVRRPLYAP